VRNQESENLNSENIIDSPCERRMHELWIAKLGFGFWWIRRKKLRTCCCTCVPHTGEWIYFSILEPNEAVMRKALEIAIWSNASFYTLIKNCEVNGLNSVAKHKCIIYEWVKWQTYQRIYFASLYYMINIGRVCYGLK